MSVSVLSLTRPLDTVSGLLQLASLLGLALLLLKAAQLYQRRQWLLKAVQQFPSPPSHWLFGHKREVGRGWTGEREGWAGWGRQQLPTQHLFGVALGLRILILHITLSFPHSLQYNMNIQSLFLCSLV